MTTVGVWDHADEAAGNEPTATDTRGPGGIKHGLNDGPSGQAEIYPLRGFGLAMGELRVWDDAASDSLASDERQGRSELLARCAGLVMGGMHLQQSLRGGSVRDPLTGLYNRGYLHETLERECLRSHQRSEPLCLLMIDIDHFAPFNDAHGAHQGDRMLQAIANCLQSRFDATEVVCRYSGERFALLMPEVDTRTADPRVDALLQTIRAIDIDQGGVTVSAGLAAYPSHGTTAAELIEAAERAIIEARNEGGDRVRQASDG